MTQKRNFSDFFGDLDEKPQGVFITPELTCAYLLDCFCARPIFSSTLRYAGFFVRDYQHRETLGTLYVKERLIQIFTLRGEFAIPFHCFQPYLGFAGRFQFDGNHVNGRLVLDNQSFSDGIDNSIGYALLGLRGSKQWGCLDFQANFEGSYDTDQSGRILGELTLNYM